jgi:hypothetical protein
MTNNHELRDQLTKMLTHTFLSVSRPTLTVRSAMSTYRNNPKLKLYIDKQVSRVIELLKEGGT